MRKLRSKERGQSRWPLQGASAYPAPVTFHSRHSEGSFHEHLIHHFTTRMRLVDVYIRYQKQWKYCTP
jgi:hypothetical protein